MLCELMIGVTCEYDGAGCDAAIRGFYAGFTACIVTVVYADNR